MTVEEGGKVNGWSEGLMYNHGRTRTRGANACASLERRERKRGVAVAVCGSLQRLQRVGVEEECLESHGQFQNSLHVDKSESSLFVMRTGSPFVSLGCGGDTHLGMG